MAREGKAPAFQFYAADWLADENVRTMSLAERGAYIDLLAFCWREGSIPNDADRCARLLGCTPKEMRSAWETVRARFTDGEPGRLVSLRMEQQRAETDAYLNRAGNGGRAASENMTPEERSERARKAAIAKHTAANEQAERKQASANDSLASANTASATASASASTKKKAIAGSKPPAGELDAIYARYPRKDGKTRGMKIAARLDASDLPDLARAVDNFAARMRDEGREREHIKQFDTFMGCWREYLDAPNELPFSTPAPQSNPADAHALEVARKVAEAQAWHAEQVARGEA